MNSEVPWVLVSSGIQVQLQIILDPDYLADYLSVSYGSGSFDVFRCALHDYDSWVWIISSYLSNYFTYLQHFLNRLLNLDRVRFLWLWSRVCSVSITTQFRKINRICVPAGLEIPNRHRSGILQGCLLYQVHRACITAYRHILSSLLI